MSRFIVCLEMTSDKHLEAAKSEGAYSIAYRDFSQNSSNIDVKEGQGSLKTRIYVYVSADQSSYNQWLESFFSSQGHENYEIRGFNSNY